MPIIKYPVALDQSERDQLISIVRRGKGSARTVTRARVLLMADRNGLGKSNGEVREALQLGINTVPLIKRRYCEGGIERAIHDAPRSGRNRVYGLKEEVKVSAIACTTPPDGAERWTLDLLKEEVPKRIGRDIGRTTIYRIMLRSDTRPWRKKNVVHP